jgi:hypothetical protein
MAPILNTPLVAMTGTDIQWGWQSSNAIPYSGSPLELFMYLHIDSSLFDHQWQFTANFALTEVATNQRFNNYWVGNLDGLKQWAPDLYIFMYWPSAWSAGASKSGYSYSGAPQGDGLYLYRPNFAVQIVAHWTELGPDFEGESQYAVSEEHYFIVESSP